MKYDLQGSIEVPGGSVWYGIVGAEKKGVPLLVLHGGPGAPHDYLLPLAALSDERPVVFYDQLGCGSSDKPSDTSLWTVSRFSHELSSVRTALGLTNVHILGQSWGTMLAVDYVLRNPKGVESLVLSAPCLSASRFIKDTRAYLDALPVKDKNAVLECEANGDFTSGAYQDAMMVFYKRHLCRMESWPEPLLRTIDRLGHEVYRYMWGPSEFTLTGVLKDFERAESLGKIDIPTLFTCGRYDEATPEATAYYSGKLPGSRFIVIEDASHEHHLEKPEEYLLAVRKFLNER
jgi:proline-specific peptidase